MLHNFRARFTPDEKQFTPSPAFVLRSDLIAGDFFTLNCCTNKPKEKKEKSCVQVSLRVNRI